MSQEKNLRLVLTSLEKTIQECQNGLASCIHILDIAVNFQDIESGLRGWLDKREIEFTIEEDKVDVFLPRVSATVAFYSRSVVFFAHRLRTKVLQGDPKASGVDSSLDCQKIVKEDLMKDLGFKELGDVLMGLLKSPIDQEIQQKLYGLLEHDSIFVSTLVSDLLNVNGIATIPGFINTPQQNNAQEESQFLGDFEQQEKQFEHLINVNEYAFYEAVHPAYAQQIYYATKLTEKYGKRFDRILDIGSGPGFPTIMLAEFFLGAKIHAIEPCESAFKYLCKNIQRFQQTKGFSIEPFQCGILEFSGEALYDIAISVGASHHLDTYQFLKACRKNIHQDGIVVVADEMISPFSTRKQRTENLITHHWSYIEEALRNVILEEIPVEEQKRLAEFRKIQAPTANEVKELLEKVKENRHISPSCNSPWQRVRLAILELEALVAGISYDVERKTSPENFLEMAQDAGLKLLHHVRVYATDDKHAGTHVFCFGK